MSSVLISATSRSYPRLPFEKMKDEILGNSYELSLIFVGEARARALNKQTRKKDYLPNVLSFPLTKKYGEIVITPVRAKHEAKRFGFSTRGYIGFLFIHGLLHLAGHDHGEKMEKLEKKYCTQFKLT